MKNLSIVIILLCLSTIVSAQSNSTEKQQKSKNTEQQTAPSPLVFDSLIIDYGGIVKGASGERVFHFKNTGKDPIILTDVQASCGCTVPEWTKDPVLPKKTGEIKVRYNTSIIGYFNKTIRVYSNKNPDNAVILTIKGEVVNEN
ncbi:MAG: DUF1573 domain-containing protein [Bacteroidales bacterium]|nr:DUF1573 domain-containing protein [Bacteroidales bacterium]